MTEVGRVHLPGPNRAPLASVLRRLAFAGALVVFVALVVRIGRDGYVDVTSEPIGMLDALYYASVTVTTTGYGDITAVSEGARLATILLIMPARILFLILVVGTTIEVLTDQSRQLILAKRWRREVKDHYIICGFGATGGAAVDDLLSRGIEPSAIVIVDRHQEAVDRATRLGFTAILGDATKNSVLQEAAVLRAAGVIVTPNRDDTAVLITLSVRELNSTTHIVAGGRDRENLHLLSQGGADEVIDSTAAVGRMLGIATHAPAAITVLNDLLSAGHGLELLEVTPETEGGPPHLRSSDTLVGIIRGGKRIHGADLDPALVQPSDRLVVLRDTYEN